MLLLSLCLILLLGIVLSFLCEKLRLPVLIGYLAVGIILGPFVLNLIDVRLLHISEELRKIALIFILIRASLSLDFSELKKMGRPSLLLSFVPAIFELIAIGLLTPLFFPISYLDAFILGSVLAAVSPAVVVPRMIQMVEDKQGTAKGIPQMIVAGSSIDDVVVIVIFTALTTVATGDSIGVLTYFNVPLAVSLGIASGIIIGLLLVWFFKKAHIRDTIKVIIICAISFGFVALETLLSKTIGYSGLLATITMGVVIMSRYKVLAERLSQKYSKLWVVAEIILFVMVGATVDIHYFMDNLGLGILLILCGLMIRAIGVFVSLIKTKLNQKEKLFCAIAYLPKATVQAAIGGIPLALGILSGDFILSIAVVAILFTAPLGAFAIDYSKHKLLETKKVDTKHA